MKKKYSELKVGLAVFLALLILILVIVWGKGCTLLAKSRVLDVHFDDIAGLEEGAFVLVNGMRKGKVLEFILERDGVRARCALDERVTLYDDARFEITATELMGSKVVNIWPGLSGRIAGPATIFQGDAGGGMTQLMKMSTNLVEDVRHLLGVLETTINNINKTAGDPRLQEAFISSIRNLDESSQRTLELITLNEGKLNQVMDNLVAASTSIRDVVATNSEDIEHTISDAHNLVAQLNEISTGLQQIVEKARGTDGTLGMLINDPNFAADLTQTLANVDSLVQQIREEGITTNIHLFGKKKSSKRNP